MTMFVRTALHFGVAGLFAIAAVFVVPPQVKPALAGPTAMAGTLCTMTPKWGIQVIRSFCTGPATLTLTLNGQSRTIKGGQCDHQMGMRSFNAGMMTITREVSGAPDYVGFTVPEDGSTRSLAVYLGGKKYIFQTKSGSMTDAGGLFDGSGNSMGPDQAHVVVHGVIICGH